MTDECELRHAVGEAGHACDHERCIYWQAVAHLDIDGDGIDGCAIQHFSLLEGGEEIAAWLLSLKRRIEDA